MKTCYIITPLADKCALEKVPVEADVILCADGGYSQLKKLGLKADVLVGDFDSLEDKLPGDISVIKLPEEKDETDTFACIQKGMELGCGCFCIIGGVGGRIDHTLANIQLLAWGLEHKIDIRLFGTHECIWMMEPGISAISKVEKAYLSFFAYSQTVEGLTIKGVKYPLVQKTITNLFPLCISNQFSAPKAEISFDAGRLVAMIVSQDVL